MPTAAALGSPATALEADRWRFANLKRERRSTASIASYVPQLLITGDDLRITTVAHGFT